MRYYICTKYGYLSRTDHKADGVTAHFTDSWSYIENYYNFDDLMIAMIIAIKFSIMLNQYEFFIKDSNNVITNIDLKILKCCTQVIAKLNISDEASIFALSRYMYINKHEIGNVYVLVEKKSGEQRFHDFIKYFEISDPCQWIAINLDPQHIVLITNITNDNLMVNFKLLGDYNDIAYLNCDEEWKTLDNNY